MAREVENLRLADLDPFGDAGRAGGEEYGLEPVFRAQLRRLAAIQQQPGAVDQLTLRRQRREGRLGADHRRRVGEVDQRP